MKLINVSFLLASLCFGSLFCFHDTDQLFHHYFKLSMEIQSPYIRFLHRDKREKPARHAWNILMSDPEKIIFTHSDIIYVKAHIKIPANWGPDSKYSELWTKSTYPNKNAFKGLCLAIAEKVGIDVLRNPELLNKIK